LVIQKLITAKKSKYGNNFNINFLALVWKIKKGLIQDAAFIHSDPGPAKANKPRENEAKTRRSKD